PPSTATARAAAPQRETTTVTTATTVATTGSAITPITTTALPTPSAALESTKGILKPRVPVVPSGSLAVPNPAVVWGYPTSATRMGWPDPRSITPRYSAIRLWPTGWASTSSSLVSSVRPITTPYGNTRRPGHSCLPT